VQRDVAAADEVRGYRDGRIERGGANVVNPGVTGASWKVPKSRTRS
jgi:hypothetical protein